MPKIDTSWRGWIAGLVIGLCALASTSVIAAELPEQLKGHGGPIKAISISTDGKHALTASFDYAIIYWDISDANEKIIHRMIGHDSAVNDVEFVPGMERAVSVSDDGSFGVWNLETGELITRIIGSHHKVLDVAVSPDGRRAASARWDETIRIFDLKTLEEQAILKGHRGNVNSVAFSQDGSRLYSAAYDGAIFEWDVERAQFLRPVYRHGWGINSISRIDDDRLVFGAIDGAVGIVSISSQEVLVELAKRDRPVQSVKTSPDATMIGFGDGSGRIEVFEAATGTKLESGDVTFGPVWDFDFLPGASQIYHVGLDDFAVRWQISPRTRSEIKSELPRRFQVSDTNDPGELEFKRKCSICHTLTPDGENRAGPTLYGVFGRKAGTLPGYKYSKALIETDVIWNEETIASLFDDGPDVMLPGTKMPIQRLKSVTRRDDLIRFLKYATLPLE